MASQGDLRRAKARHHALAKLAKLYHAEYQRLYREALKALGATPASRTSTTPEVKADCDHPKESWNKFPYGTWCGICNQRLR